MKKALVVGIDSYPSDPLRFCVDDATEVARLLQSSEYSFSTTTVLDAAATRQRLRSELDALFATPAESYLFYFAGHGTATDLGGYLDTVDVDSVTEGLGLDLLAKYARVRLPMNSRLIYLLDCCHAGQASIRGRQSGPVRLRNEDLDQELAALGGAGRVLLAACQEHELSYEYSQFGHGAFTYHLIAGLCGYAADSSGEVTPMSLFDHITRGFKDHSRQTPVFRGDLAGRFVLGSGFTPTVLPPEDSKALAAVESEAHQLLEAFHRELTQLRLEPSAWRTGGFRQAATSLEGLLRWFDGKLSKYRTLSTRDRFMTLQADLRTRQAELCQLSPGTVTVEGEVVSALGHGNFGSVWRVRSTTPGQADLAYKVFHPQDLADREKVDRFERGFQAMERMDHPRIVRVHRLTRCPYGYYMDFIPGSNLRRFVGTFDEPIDTLDLLITIAETLHHAHGRGVVHRDVKPENVLMTYENQKRWVAYLTDFDLAWISTATQLTKSALGATFYASPEQIDKPGSASARAKTTDIYSFGQLMYFAFCASDPQRDGSSHALEARLRVGWSEEASRRLVTLYSTCTEHAPAKRPGEFRSVLDDLVRIRALLTHDPDARLSEEVFVKELAFSLLGLGAEVDAQGAFLSLSGKLRIRVDVPDTSRESRIVVSVHCIEAPSMPGVNHQKMREILMSRVESAMHHHPRAEKMPGDNLPFQVYITIREALTRNGATRVAELLARVTDAIESVA